MALQLQTEIDNTNLFADYYRLVEFKANYITQTLDITLALYESHEARLNDKQPITYKNISVPLENHYREELYNKIKELDEFKNSINI